MRGYISVFTKIILLIILLLYFFSLNKEMVDFKYDFINQMDKWISYKNFIEFSVEENIANLIEFSCLENMTVNRKVYLDYEIELDGDYLCGEDCIKLSKDFEKEVKLEKGERFITISCERGIE